MKRVLLTGMSGTGKSSIVRELAARGFKAVDTDDGWSEPLPDGRQMWRADAVQALLATEDADVLFVAGCEENQAQFHARFDHIILLSAPLEVLAGRLATRTSNPYGKAPETAAHRRLDGRKHQRAPPRPSGPDLRPHRPQIQPDAELTLTFRVPEPSETAWARPTYPTMRRSVIVGPSAALR